MPRRLLRPSASLSWQLAFAGFFALAAITLASFIRSDIAAVRSRADSVADGTAELIAGHATSAFTQSVQAMRMLSKRIVSLDISDPGTRTDLHQQFALLVAASEPIGSLWSVDARGEGIVDDNSSSPASPSVAARDYFQANQNGTDVFIGGRGLGTISKRPRFIVSLRMTGANGEFRGSLVAGMDVSHFQNIYRSSRRSSGVDAVMLRTDGVILASWPSDDTFEFDPAWLTAAKAQPWSLDNGREVFSIHQVGNFPVYVVAHLDLAAELRQWQKRAAIALLLFAAAVTSFGLLMRRGLGLAAEAEDARRDLENRVEQRTAELKVLYDELNHRVKNNLQLVAALVRIGGTGITDSEASLALRQTSQRIDALADVHRLLDDATGDVRVAPFVTRLLDRLRDSFAAPEQTVETRLTIPQHLHLSSGEAVALGIALNEIITNAFKHAFNGRPRGSIHISYAETEGRHAFSVTDDGVGIRPAVPTSTGSRVTEAMIAKLGGEVETSTRGQGTTVRVTFPANRPD